jgi:hypothetical protein
MSPTNVEVELKSEGELAALSDYEDGGTNSDIP